MSYIAYTRGIKVKGEAAKDPDNDARRIVAFFATVDFDHKPGLLTRRHWDDVGIGRQSQITQYAIT